MPDKPVPLREALREAVEETIRNCVADVGPNGNQNDCHMCEEGKSRIAALLSKIPAGIEINDGN